MDNVVTDGVDAITDVFALVAVTPGIELVVLTTSVVADVPGPVETSFAFVVISG